MTAHVLKKPMPEHLRAITLVQVEPFDIDEDSEDERESESHTIITPNGRKIAGCRRMARVRDGLTPSDAQAEVFQSITATPAFSGQSFEETRLECYRQSAVATGTRPQPVDPVVNPWAVIPPIFNARRWGVIDLGLSLDAEMAEAMADNILDGFCAQHT